MDDLTPFERQFEDRVRAFARTGVRPVDSAAVARAVAVGHPRSGATGRAVRWLGLTLDRRAWAIAVAVGLLVVLLGGALLVGARLLPMPSPVNLRLAHLVYVLDDDIYVADWDGTGPVRIVDSDPAAECGGVFGSGRGLVSPDGRHIAYRSAWGDGCRGTVSISDLEGNLVASFPGDGWNIAWSPDGTRVATWLPDTDQMIGIYDLEGTLQAALDGSRMCCGDYDPVWSPDGSASIIVKESGTSGPVWELPVDGSTPRRVPLDDPRVSMAYLLRPPAYSSDGTRAAFIVPWEMSNGPWPQLREDPYALRDYLVVSAADGTQPQVLFEADPSQGLNQDQKLVWSASGDRIAYVLSREVNHDPDGNVTLVSSDLWVVDPRTRAATMLATALGSQPIQPLSFSPEGDRLVYLQADESGDRSLWFMYTDGSGAPLQRSGGVFPGPGSLEPLDVAPDADRILVGQTDPNGTRSIWFVGTDGESGRMLVEGTDFGTWVSLPADAEDPITP